MFVYALAIAPGHPAAFYQAAAPKIGARSGPTGGAMLFFLAGAWIGGRRPERNAVAQAALFLASPAALFITGQTLLVDGGITVTDWG